METETRHRDVAHLWADKRISRFFRRSFDKRWARRFRDVYFALCEIDSDFSERGRNPEKQINHLTTTCSTYSGLDQNMVSQIMIILRALGLIDYQRRRNEKGQIVEGTELALLKWMGEEIHIKEYGENLGIEETDTLLLRDHIRLSPNKAIASYKNPKGVYYKNSSEEEGSLRTSPKGEGSAPDGAPFPPSRLRRPDKTASMKQSLLSQNHHSDPKPIPAVPKSILFLMDYWNHIGGRQHLDPKSKVYQDSVACLKKLMMGRFFTHNKKYEREFSDQEIIKGFDYMKQSISPDYEPRPGGYKEKLKHMSMLDFFWSVYTGRSKFLDLLESPPKPLSNQIPLQEDTAPAITGVFLEFWRKEVCGGVNGHHSNSDMNKFRQGSARAKEFLKKYQRNMIGITDQRDYAEMVCGALRDSYENNMSKMEIGCFGSDRTWNKLVPRYFNSQGVLMDME